MKCNLSTTKVVLMVIVLIVTACAPAATQQTGSGGAAPAASDQPLPIRLVTWDAEPLVLDAISATKSDSYAITHEPIASRDDYFMKLQSVAAAGDLPHLMWMAPDPMILLLENKRLLNIAELCPEMSDVLKAYPVYTVEAFQRSNEVYGLPWLLDLKMLYVNRKLFDGAGIAYPPKTMSELLEYADKLTIKEDSGAIVQAGLAVQGFGEQGACYASGSFEPCPASWQEMMRAGKVAMMIDWATQDYDRTDKPYGSSIYSDNIVAYIPPGADEGTWATTIGVAATSVSIKAAEVEQNTVCSTLRDLSERLRTSSGFLFTPSDCTAQETVDRIVKNYLKPEQSARNLVDASCKLNSDNALPADIVGEAIPVPGDPVIQEAFAQLSTPLSANTPLVNINLNRAVTLDDVHTAPVNNPNVNEEQFWSVAAEKGFIVAVVVIPDNEINIPSGAYAVQVRGSSGEEQIQFIAPGGDVYTPPYLGRSANPYPTLGPYAGINRGSDNCVYTFLWWRWVCRCR